MELKEDFIKDNELNEDQVKAVIDLTNANEADLKKQWDGKANEDAEGILTGAAKKVQDLTGIERENGQKIADYISFAGEKYFEGSQATIDRKSKELDEKIKNAGTDAGLKKELEEAKLSIDQLKKIEAEHDEFIKGDYKNLYEKNKDDLSKMQMQVAWSNVRPKFAESVNEYEGKAKWNEFIADVMQKNDIVLDEDNSGIAVDKENKYKTFKLSELVKEDKTLQELIKGRELTGLGSTQKTVDVDGVPFKIPENASPKERQKAITDYIVGDLKIGYTTAEFPKKFSEFNKKILEKIPA